MARLKTFVNGGTLLATDLNNFEDDYECAFDTYKLVAYVGAASVGSAVTAGVFSLGNTGGNGGVGITGLLNLDPSRYWSAAATSSVNPRTVYYNLSAWGCTQSGTAPGVSFTVGLYAVSSVSGPSYTLAGSPVTGSTVTFTTPSAGVTFNGYSGDFAAPAAGNYMVGVLPSGTTASGSWSIFCARLLIRQK